uniref:Uncharacterized protein n=1 Tax=Arion vulgaris TaxID=1028688 RepID=A0A0B6ZID6_9EUPU
MLINRQNYKKNWPNMRWLTVNKLIKITLYIVCQCFMKIQTLTRVGGSSLEIVVSCHLCVTDGEIVVNI